MISNFTHSESVIYSQIEQAAAIGQRCFAILFDPEEVTEEALIKQIEDLPDYTTHLFVGGSTATEAQTQLTVREIKKKTDLPVVLFPGDHNQITAEADALLFLSLISGENPEYLIRQQIKSVQKLKDSTLEIIPTGYILIDGGVETAVQRVSKTEPLAQDDIEHIVAVALAGQYSGKKLLYLEAGSGAVNPVSVAVIKAVKQYISIPLIVGGGIRTREQLQRAYEAGADLVVVGTAFENGNFRT
ncbi:MULTISPECIES: geranylgeranylglyceryl/heptaprenylglyceryl phosphate synthase [unclassified Leeuwenhoekiella]|uniref:geranylgeranylglyceryl/heptaprenylglyceryl phosphate synthase n=1 Tax=unclassified Leeuwenhoekiella TaxID=2615029 RepID=UPI000C4FFECE|nr:MULTISPECIES: geranylgeranylglyceryl/heptaprenylglyceryl phosphate synthase [unclassified Leeuwenhoekiella]MAW96784.1 geranylgeranylglyceryl/heptaprenylglyceryl phosphate synthase [Leeuwenhoekiella sp.]MBA82379.1 geranylgeranylglyceryl/heptaprenylglyceryl phosphate synthase [Leeuwenhoekiella sp.]|tara:strand:+ start:3681 stop:4412 length:732 start_codon:yes stop_codon:yes gene_type:complete